jgi:hypothetical protein
VSSKRAIRRKACKGKQRFESLGDAWTALRSLIRRQAPTRPMNAYPCKFCGGFHFGHTPAELLKARGAR